MAVNEDGSPIGDKKDYPIARAKFKELVVALNTCTPESDMMPLIKALEDITEFCSNSTEEIRHEVAMVVIDGYGWMSLAKLMVNENVAVSDIIGEFKNDLTTAANTGQYVNVDIFWREQIEPIIQKLQKQKEEKMKKENEADMGKKFDDLNEEIKSTVDETIESTNPTPDEKATSKVAGWFEKQSTPVKVATGVAAVAVFAVAVYAIAYAVSKYLGGDDSDVIISE